MNEIFIFFSDPTVLAAIFALVGVAATLTLTGHLARAESRFRREDEYLTEMRSVISKLLIDIEEFRRQGVMFSRPEVWSQWPFEIYEELAKETENRLRSYCVSILNAKLLAQDKEIINSLNSLDTAVDNACIVMNEIHNKYKQGEYAEAVINIREIIWEKMNDESQKFLESSREKLKPTIRRRGRRWHLPNPVLHPEDPAPASTPHSWPRPSTTRH